MKVFDRILLKAVRNDFIWSAIKPFAKAINYIQEVRSKTIFPKKDWSKFNSLFSDLIVLHGPFKGMQYPDLKSAGSALYPKLLGSYERELHDEIEKFISNEYSLLIDVGCAEGYYAVGFALRNKKIKVNAYDIDNQARELCEKMAILNKVKDRISIEPVLCEDTLSEFKFQGKCLLICDIEGFEKKLFTSRSVKNLSKCDLLIETHDFLDLDISSYLYELFNDTHDISIIKSIDDIQKVKYYQYSLLNNLNGDEKKVILSEHRSSIMEWLVLKSKTI